MPPEGPSDFPFEFDSSPLNARVRAEDPSPLNARVWSAFYFNNLNFWVMVI